MLHTQNPCGVDKEARPIKLKLRVGKEADITSTAEMIADLPEGAVLLADKGYNSKARRKLVANFIGYCHHR